MTKMVTPGNSLDYLETALIDDMLSTPDSEFLEEIKSDGQDPHTAADRVRTIVEKGSVLAAKSKLRAAQAAVEANRSTSVRATSSIDPARARQLLKELSSNDPEFRKKVTLAARNEEHLSDEDVLGIIEDLRDLGVIPDEDSEK